jgi:small subunit ribosomal protein S17
MREQRKVLVGRVTSNRMDKTVIVEVRQRKRHRLYGKVLNVRKRFKAHDEDNACQIGDLVRMIEFRPLSREKRWMVTNILETGVKEPTSEGQSGVIGTADNPRRRRLRPPLRLRG